MTSVTTGMPCVRQRVDGGDDRGVVRRLEHARRASRGGRMSSSVLTVSSASPSSRRWKRERITAGRRAGSSDSSAVRTADENRSGASHDQVDDERPPPDPHLGPLALQVGDRLVHLGDGAGADTGPLVQDPVDRGLAEAGLLGDLADPEQGWRLRMRPSA